MRLEWVQFLLEVNGQRLKESDWTDITICKDHFSDDCFLSPTPASGTVQLKSSAVPSLCLKAEPDEPLESPQCVLFRRKCPSCGFKLLMKKVTYGVLIILNQQCLKCDYKFQWKSEVNATVPTAVEQHLTGGTEVPPEIKQEVVADDDPSNRVFSEIVSFSDEESNPSEEGEEDDESGVSSDGDWNPTGDFLLAEELSKESEEETEDEGEEEEFDSQSGLKIQELCTECGSFYTLKPHTCEHKSKPFSCNICGKRCVTEISLKNHSIIHDETYEHPCKYCHVTFKTRVDKLKHEQTHQDSKQPYKCPDCPKTFATNKARRIHLSNHRAPEAIKCGVCGVEFGDLHHLRRHSVVHTGLKPFKCSVCQRSFNQSSNLKSHMRLHTGERPFKCKHCDKRFNHNVSLKSHIQRYHSSGSGWEPNTGKEDDGDREDSVAEDNGNKNGSDSEFDDVEEEKDREEEVQKETKEMPKSKNNKRKTGRPRGRPKRNAAGDLVPAGRKSGSKNKTRKSKVQKLKDTGSSGEDSEEELSDSDISFGSVEEEEEEEKTVRKRKGRSRGRPKNDSDSDFDPEEDTKKRRCSSLSGGESSGKHKGRPKKNVEV
uniref:uncharacterized protein n=1 Tax=Semicossyphus pulcher TaxID=241346 RepID=UPI0037E6F936